MIHFRPQDVRPGRLQARSGLDIVPSMTRSPLAALRTVAFSAAIAFSAGLPSLAWADGVAVDVATPDQKLEAKTAFEGAVKLFEKEKWADALGGFTQSHGVVASPNASFMMARCLDKLNRPDEAYNTLIDVEAESKGLDKYKQTLQQASDLRAELSKKIAVLKVTLVAAPPGATLAIKGAPATAGRDHAILPGAYDVVVSVDGKPVKTEQGNAAAMESKAISVDLTPAATPPTPIGPTPLPPQPLPPQQGPAPTPVKKGGSSGTGYFIGAGILGAVGVAGFAVGIPFGLMAQGNKDDLDADCPNFRCSISAADLDDRKSTIDQQSLIATIGFIAGGVATAGAVTLAIVGATRPKQAAQPSVGLVVGPTSVGVAGAF